MASELPQMQLLRLSTNWLAIVMLHAAATSAIAADGPAPPPAETIELREFLVLPAVGHYGRLPVHRDAVEVQLVTGVWQPPVAGDPVEVADGPAKQWRGATVENGALATRTLRGGYAFATFDSPTERVMLLDAAGHAAVYVNGEVRTGDPYGLGWLWLPVLVREGENTLLFHVAGEQLSARLVMPPADVFLLDEDRTLPTLVLGETEPLWGAIPVVNATTEWQRDLRVECGRAGGEVLSTPVALLAPLSVRKVAFQIPPGGTEAGTPVPYTVQLLGGASDEPLDEAAIELAVVGPQDIHVRTFRSGIDGSVQPYAVRPAAQSDGEPSSSPGIVVTLHDAGVDCRKHVAQYATKDWAHVVAPQGRRPYGFDWEDWGRQDVLEALADARKRYANDPRRTYLTGQAMGGHGVWHLGVTYPDRFAAIGPSGGWASFWSYGGGMPTFQNPDALESLLLRSYATSDTVQLLPNLSDVGVYVLHGAADEAVPVAQARFMRGRLAGFHANFAYYEEADAAHATDNQLCDWPPMMAFFERLARPLPAERTTLEFTTADPGVSSRCDWVTIEAQQDPLALSRVDFRRDLDTRSFVGQTTNVARLSMDVSQLSPGQPIDVTLDGQRLDWIDFPADTGRLWFARRDNQWELIQRPGPALKSPERCGPFKSAFEHEPLLVYGTGGTEEEDRWGEAKARYDAETFWYRGGGSLEILPDTAFDAAATLGRNVVLYGNADTNSAWNALLSECPVQVERGQVRVGERVEEGDDLAVLMVYPRPDSDVATVGVVAGTGPVGMAATNRLRYFVSGIGYPDLMVVGADALHDGPAAIRAWGYFSPDWRIDGGNIAWRDGP